MIYWDLTITICQQHSETLSTYPIKLNISLAWLLDYFPSMGIKLLNARSGPRLIVHGAIDHSKHMTLPVPVKTRVFLQII